MPTIGWLVLAIGAGVAAYVVAWPAWTAYRARESRDLNADRYLAWRGRADRRPKASTREGFTGAERRRLGGGILLAALAVAALVAFFVTS